MPKCPMCTDGKMKFHQVFPFDKDKPDEITYSDCYFCGATGVVDQEFVDEWERQKKMWCECGNPSEDSYYVPDNEHPDISKHHWRCMDCRKVVQVG